MIWNEKRRLIASRQWRHFRNIIVKIPGGCACFRGHPFGICLYSRSDKCPDDVSRVHSKFGSLGGDKPISKFSVIFHNIIVPNTNQHSLAFEVKSKRPAWAQLINPGCYSSPSVKCRSINRNTEIIYTNKINVIPVWIAEWQRNVMFFGVCLCFFSLRIIQEFLFIGNFCQHLLRCLCQNPSGKKD